MYRPKNPEEMAFQASVTAVQEDDKVRAHMRDMIKGHDVGLDMYAHLERAYFNNGISREAVKAGLWACSLSVVAQWSREVGDLFPKSEWDKICVEEAKRGEA